MVKTSSGTPRSSVTVLDRGIPMAAMAMPEMRERSTAVWTAERVPFLSPEPMQRAMTTLAPRARPVYRLMMRLMAGILLPAAAMASLPTKRPSTKMSAAVKSCWKRPVSATGRAKTSILRATGPWSMSMSRDAGWEPDIGASGKEQADNREEKAEKKEGGKEKKRGRSHRGERPHGHGRNREGKD